MTSATVTLRNYYKAKLRAARKRAAAAGYEPGAWKCGMDGLILGLLAPMIHARLTPMAAAVVKMQFTALFDASARMQCGIDHFEMVLCEDFRMKGKTRRLLKEIDQPDLVDDYDLLHRVATDFDQMMDGVRQPRLAPKRATRRVDSAGEVLP